MKKVVITTFFKAENYGAVLQAYALEEVLQQKDYDVEFLNYRDTAIENVYRMVNLKRQNLYLSIRGLMGTILFYRRKKKRHLQFLEFQSTYLQIGKKEYESVESIKQDPPAADIYITGSDQVWNAAITNGLSDIYTLNFGSSQTKRISYAASIGSEDILPMEKEKLKEKISIIDYVSVREVTAQILLNNILPDKRCARMLDPVLLRGREKWEADISAYGNHREEYILAYYVEADEEFKKSVNLLSEKTGLKVIHFEKRKQYENELCSAYTEGPLGFINLIKNAGYVITTSFHGTAFSILFQKKFWTFPHHSTGSRVTDLLHLLGVSERAVRTSEEFQAKKYNAEIDYLKVNSKLEHEREKSLQWLDMALKEGYGNR